ncbi:MAG: D-alanyl-D-alanine carboxypeptidase [Azospira oryzae]|jgi:D-alanyl-D-alanine carboxypeptidase/D-alanyl-D-alanine-endopeptidase (penicillin-binding protein 4)|nr:MAG: D-alanyl-D-alanine carboxypeptidase [Azospira oryzae]
MRSSFWKCSAVIGFISCFFSCSPVSFLKKEIVLTEKELKDHTGFMLYDPVAKKIIYEHQSGNYFTPASNTKIFTFYTALQILKDSVPALRYQVKNDSLIFWGTGDASFLYPEVNHNSKVVDFLSDSTKKLFFSGSNFHTTAFGPGWAWDDYNDYYSAERSPFPIYGNRISIQSRLDDHLTFSPVYFSNQVVNSPEIKSTMEIIRDEDSNQLTVYKGTQKREKKFNIPFQSGNDVLTELLADTLRKTVEEVNTPLPADASYVYSTPADSLYKVMMQESDNFIAEQVLLTCAGIVSDTLDPEIAIRYARKNFLSDLPDEPVWIDGSGLSRYNLFTPRSIVALWEKIYTQVPRERLFNLLATGGQRGTLKNFYKAEKPYLYGKTGSLSNNHCLSGYLITKKGKTLIFSFMSNNFVVPTKDVRARMEKILLQIRDNY